MDQTSFNAVTQTVTHVPSRRDVLRGLAGAGLGLGLLRRPEALDAKEGKKNKKKKKPKKPQPNAFGCFNVGQPCRGNSVNCCSGICQGNKPKRGKQDKSKCVAHDTGTCNQEAAGVCTGAVPALAACNNRTDCGCFRTTAASSYCAELFGPGLSQCATCQRDADCVAMGLPAGSACAPVSEGFCAGLCATGMACLVPCGTVPPAM